METEAAARRGLLQAGSQALLDVLAVVEAVVKVGGVLGVGTGTPGRGQRCGVQAWLGELVLQPGGGLGGQPGGKRATDEEQDGSQSDKEEDNHSQPDQEDDEGVRGVRGGDGQHAAGLAGGGQIGKGHSHCSCRHAPAASDRRV